MDDTRYAQSSIAQLGIGKLEIETMAYRIWNKELAYISKIEIRSLKAGDMAGWGKRIFDGTLGELIDLVIKATKTEG